MEDYIYVRVMIVVLLSFYYLNNIIKKKLVERSKVGHGSL
jgi:hypothetical protein